jgi:hypothetical protein
MAKPLIVGLATLTLLLGAGLSSLAQEGILRGPTPPLVVNPAPAPPKTPSAPSPPSSPAVKPPAGTAPEKGIINPRTGEHYPGTIGGVINPRTGEVLPKVDGGYINPKTGEILPEQK